MNKSTSTIEDLPAAVLEDILKGWVRASEVSSLWNSVLLRTKERALYRNIDSVANELLIVPAYHNCDYCDMSDFADCIHEHAWETHLCHTQWGYEACLYDLNN